MREIHRVLVTGSEGYIGTVLMPMLFDAGYAAEGLDACYYASGNLTGSKLQNYRLVCKDVRDVEAEDLGVYDAIVHLAALSNDPLGKLDESLTLDVNYKATVRLAELARKVGVKRFVFASSCSLYGQRDKAVTEEDPANPQTAYGRSKILAETELRRLASHDFSPVYMRNATAFGLSPRMRFDIVVNSLTGFAHTTGKIQILGDGTPWRPLVHVKDICAACVRALEADRELMHNQAFNVGSTSENYQIRTIAEYAREAYPACEISIAQKNAGDTRNYTVSFKKCEDRLDLRMKWSLRDGIGELKQAYERSDLDYATFDGPLYTRLKMIEKLLGEGRLDESLRWSGR